MTCLHQGNRITDSFEERTLRDVNGIHADPTWRKNNLTPILGTHDGHALQTYRMAVRQELRKRGLPVHL